MTSAAVLEDLEPFNPSVPFTRKRANEVGIKDADLQDPKSAYVRIFRGVYIARSVTRTVAVRARAAMLIAPKGAVISHHTAARLWRGAVPDSTAIHVIIKDTQTFDVIGVRTHRYRRVPKFAIVDGIHVTSPERTFADMAEYLDLVQMVTLGDRLVRRTQTSPERLAQFGRNWDRPRAAAIKRAAAYVREGVDSPPESRLRMLLVLAGLPEPKVNHILRKPVTGDIERRIELAYEVLLIAIEYSGRWHREDDGVWSADIDRREEMDRRTWRTIEVIAKGLDQDPLATLRRVDLARVDRGAPSIGLFRDEWRAYFQGRAP